MSPRARQPEQIDWDAVAAIMHKSERVGCGGSAKLLTKAILRGGFQVRVVLQVGRNNMPAGFVVEKGPRK